MGQMLTKRVRQTGTLVTIVSAVDLELDDCDGTYNWFTICEEHGTAIAHRTKRLAMYHSSQPKDWCEHCWSPEHLWCDEHREPKVMCESLHEVIY
jgi:hypothetical protein